MQDVIIVTGMGGAGKSTHARSLLNDERAIVATDEYRYEPGSWKKVPRDLYVGDVFEAIDNITAAGKVAIVEGIYLDTSDPEDARGYLMRALLSRAQAVHIVECFATSEAQCTALRERFERREQGLERPAARPETEASVARLQAKCTHNFNEVVASLHQLAASAGARSGCTWVPREDTV